MADFRAITCKLAHGQVVLYAAQPYAETPARPVVLMSHGALRNAAVFASWADLLADVADVVLMDLPGHGRSDPIAPASVGAMAEALRLLIETVFAGRRVLLVGESLAATIFLAVCGPGAPEPIRALFAADPPMSTAKLWPVANHFRQLRQAGDLKPFLEELARDSFGIRAETVEEILYYPLLGAVERPTLVASGDLALLPQRPVAGIPCVFDEVDRFVLETFYADKAQFRRIEDCGHLMLTQAQPQCLEIIRGLLAEHVSAPAVQQA